MFLSLLPFTAIQHMIHDSSIHFNIILLLQGGTHVPTLLDSFTNTKALKLVAFLQMIGVTWIYGKSIGLKELPLFETNRLDIKQLFALFQVSTDFMIM